MGQEVVVFGTVQDDQGKGIADAAVVSGEMGVSSGYSGTYELRLRRDVPFWIYFSHVSYPSDSVLIDPSKGRRQEINPVLELMANLIPEVDVADESERYDEVVRLDAKDVAQLPGPAQTVEGLIKTLPGVSSNNEFSSQYSVRGGNFDENLVYINDIEVYRPFLVRAGQQEGLSFINPDMVQSIEFSAGGFEARYGDKMSSVLDITYKKPTEFSTSVMLSLLGGSLAVGGITDDKKFSFLTGARYRTNQILVGSLDTEADYRPRYTDIQAYLNYEIKPRWNLSLLTTYSRNLFQTVPETRQTEFGTISEALRLTVFFDGQEITQYETFLGALSLDHQISDQTRIRFIASGFLTDEQEYFDILGQYRLSELDNDLGSEDFGEEKFERGVGGFLDHARNLLQAQVFTFTHKGEHRSVDGDQRWFWGAKAQTEYIDDVLKEWNLIDSAGYSLPQAPGDQVLLFESIDAANTLNSWRFQTYGQYRTLWKNKKNETFTFNGGLRLHYWTVNRQLLVSPRASISYKPKWEKDMVFRFASGIYYQSPFYREIRDYYGEVNEGVRAQRSIHFVLANDYQFKAFNRPFKFTTELYYKSLTDLVPYYIDNVRIRYSAENNAVGYAVGADFRINGEFVPGIESWASMSVMTIREDILDDFFIDDNGNRVEPGYIPRPTDQRVTFNIFFQDYLPNDPTLKVNLNLVYGSGLPFGAPQSERYQQTARIPAYRRVDIGFTKTLVSSERQFESGIFSPFKSLVIGVEVFNLLGIRNTVSYLWVQDVSGRPYAVPNYLTNRLLNVKIIATL